MSATEIMGLAAQNIAFIGPALLVFCGLAFADSIFVSLYRIVRSASKHFRL